MNAASASHTLYVKWGTSRGRDTYGYTTCALWEHGRRLASCNGGGYDMRGTVFGNWLAAAYRDRLLKLKAKDMPEGKLCGLTFHDPGYDPSKAIIGEQCDDRTLGKGANGKTVEQAEKDGESLGLERYQAFYRASSKVPTKRHTVPLIGGACGFESVRKIAEAIGLSVRVLNAGKKLDIIEVSEAG